MQIHRLGRMLYISMDSTGQAWKNKSLSIADFKESNGKVPEY